MPDARQIEGDAGFRDGCGSYPARRGLKRDQPLVPLRNPFSVLGAPMSPLRLMFAPLEFALYLPAYAIDSLHGHGERR